MSLQPTFTLTPRSPRHWAALDNRALMYCFGPMYGAWSPYTLDDQYANDHLYFHMWNAGDPALAYTSSPNRWPVPRVRLYADLSAFGPHKELALLFGFQATTTSRLLVFTDAGQVADETLKVGDDQLLIQLEDLSNAFSLYFIHGRLEGSNFGGNWFFEGITGYVV